jgi:hypothetical protein
MARLPRIALAMALASAPFGCGRDPGVAKVESDFREAEARGVKFAPPAVRAVRAAPNRPAGRPASPRR